MRYRFCAGLLFFLLIRPLLSAEKRTAGPDVLVVADAITTETEAHRPIPGRPVYYYLLGKRERAVGHPYAGEKMPSFETIERAVEKTLAARGYVRTRKRGPAPALCAMILWGTASAMIDDLPREDGTAVWYNQREMRQLMGADKASRHHGNDPQENERINRHIGEDRVYLMLGMFDAAALAEKKKKLVWRTTMSIATLRDSFPESLDTMLASAAPYIGRSTDKAVTVTEADRHNATVKLGPLEVMDTVPATEKAAGQ